MKVALLRSMADVLWCTFIVPATALLTLSTHIGCWVAAVPSCASSAGGLGDSTSPKCPSRSPASLGRKIQNRMQIALGVRCTLWQSQAILGGTDYIVLGVSRLMCRCIMHATCVLRNGVPEVFGEALGERGTPCCRLAVLFLRCMRFLLPLPLPLPDSRFCSLGTAEDTQGCLASVQS